MNIEKLIGQAIVDILVWSKMEVGGLDEAEVSICLGNNKTISIPWDFESANIERQPKKGSESLFRDLSEIPIHHINKEGKSIQEILDAQKKRDNSLLGRIRVFLGIVEHIPKEYKTYKVEYRENKLKYLKNQKVIDFLMIEGFDSVGFLELENGYIITERSFSPHGTGAAGLEFYENIQEFERHHGNEYLRFTEKHY